MIQVSADAILPFIRAQNLQRPPVFLFKTIQKNELDSDLKTVQQEKILTWNIKSYKIY